MAKKDYYKVLNLSKSASEDELKKAYRKLAMQYHPDKNAGDRAAEEKFKEVNEAYETLKDPQKRKMYDQFGHAAGGFAGAGAQNRGRAGGFDPFGGFGGRPSGASNEEVHDVFNDFFSDFFGNTSPGRQKRSSGFGARGADLRYTVSITFEEAASGCEKVISFVRQKGNKEETAKLSITVPAGVKSGQRLKLKGEGDSAPRGGKPGDLYVVVNLQEHALFTRIENDIHMKLPIAFTDAILGSSIEIATLTGKANLKVPPYTSPGQVFRLKGKGFPSLDGAPAGDMLIKAVIDIPDSLNKDQIDLITKLRQSIDETPKVKDYKEKTNKLFRVRK